MLYIDGISLSKIRQELDEVLRNKKINRIFKNNEFSISLHFGKQELLFSCLPTFPICYIAQNREKPILDIASSLISNLRKYLMNSILIGVEQLDFDRILVFNFSKINELGEFKKYKIYFECTGKFSNLVFTDEENKIIDSLKKYSINSNLDRTLFNGEIYKQPNSIDKFSPVLVDKNIFEELKKEDLLTKKIEGIGKFLEKYLVNFEEFNRILHEKITPKIFFKDSKILLATVLDIEAQNFDEVKNFETFNEFINYYIEYQNITTSFVLLKKRLLTSLTRKKKKYDRILILIEKDLMNDSKSDEIKQKADIIASVLYKIEKGMSEVLAFDFYNNSEIKIALNPMLSPKENLDRTYKEYNKKKRTFLNALRRKEEVIQELNYIESSIVYVEKAKDLTGLREIEEELTNSGYVKKVYVTKKTKIKKDIKYGSLELDDSIIFFGRNNLENDNVTFKVANKEDFWFHVEKYPSSHVIVRTAKLTDEIIKKAAQISSFYSSIPVGEKVTVNYTLKKYVKKPSGSKLGFVTYTNFKSIVVEKIDLPL